jgi:hypothetical protein
VAVTANGKRLTAIESGKSAQERTVNKVIVAGKQ